MFFLLISLLLSPSPKITFEFHHTIVEMPLGANPYDYVELPYAKVFVDGVEDTDARVIYERGVERTFLSVLHTKEVKSFFIKYRVYAPEYDLTETITIRFNVYDDIAPTITLRQPLIFEVDTHIHFLEMFQFSDNYDDVEDLNIYIFDANINVNQVGTYILTVHVKDQSNNETIQQFFVELKDFIAPSIDLLKEIQIEVYDHLNIFDFIKVNDNHDQNLIVNIMTDEVDFDTLGTYDLRICVSDQSLNTTCIDSKIVVIDTTSPEIQVVTYTPIIEVHTIFDQHDFYQFIVDVHDNYDALTIQDIEVQTDIRLDIIGQYYITYNISDASFNNTEVRLKVEVKDTIAPIVTLKEPLMMDVFSSLKPWSIYFIIQDNHDDETRLDIRFESDVDTSILGTYTLEVRVKDGSKNEANYLFFVEVIDRVAPEITLDDAIIITNFKQPNYTSIIPIQDNYDPFNMLSIQIHDTHVNYDTIGSYVIEIIISDLSLNVTSRLIDVFIIDILPPEIILTTEKIDIDIQVQELNYKSMIREVKDNITPLEIEDVSITSNVVFGKVGAYDVFYRVNDASLSETVVTLKVQIDVLIEPYIQAHDVTFQLSEDINLDLGISYKAKDISHVHMLYDDRIYSEAGLYEVVYIVYDHAGNHYIVTSFITIEDTSLQSLIQGYTPMISILILGVVISIFLKKFLSVDSFDKHHQFIYNETTEHTQEN
ncbi:MAG: hypothetical protein ACPGJL_00620 [Acholeplasmataceae bacterium]